MTYRAVLNEVSLAEALALQSLRDITGEVEVTPSSALYKIMNKPKYISTNPLQILFASLLVMTLEEEL